MRTNVAIMDHLKGEVIPTKISGKAYAEIYRLIRTGVRLIEFNASPLEVAATLKGLDLDELRRVKVNFEEELNARGIDPKKL